LKSSDNYSYIQPNATERIYCTLQYTGAFVLDVLLPINMDYFPKQY
jgi:hypothetical protein